MLSLLPAMNSIFQDRKKEMPKHFIVNNLCPVIYNIKLNSISNINVKYFFKNRVSMQ